MKDLGIPNEAYLVSDSEEGSADMSFVPNDGAVITLTKPKVSNC